MATEFHGPAVQLHVAKPVDWGIAIGLWGPACMVERRAERTQEFSGIRTFSGDDMFSGSYLTSANGAQRNAMVLHELHISARSQYAKSRPR